MTPCRSRGLLGSDVLQSDETEAFKSSYSLLPYKDCQLRYWRTFVVFATMGAGANWVREIFFVSQLLSSENELFPITHSLKISFPISVHAQCSNRKLLWLSGCSLFLYFPVVYFSLNHFYSIFDISFSALHSIFNFTSLHFQIYFSLHFHINFLFHFHIHNHDIFFHQVCPAALAQQIPYFEQHNPEGLCIATFMNASTNLGVLTVIIYFFLIRYIYPIPHSIAVPIILISSPFAAYLVSFVYNVTINNISIFLFLCCSIGGSVGALSSVIMNPFLTKYKNDFISASRSGGSFCIVLSAILAGIQGPGSKNPRFGTKYYMLLMGTILSFPIFAYFYIINNNIGLRDEIEIDNANNNNIDDDDDIDIIFNEINNSNRKKSFINSKNELENINNIKYSNINETDSDKFDFCVSKPGKDHIIDDSYEELFFDNHNNVDNNNNNNDLNHINLIIEEKREINNDNNNNINDNNNDNGNNNVNNKGTISSANSTNSDISFIETKEIIKSYTSYFIELVISKKILKKNPYLIQVLPLCCVIGFVNMNTWGIVTALSPFAFKNVSMDGQGSSSLGLAYEFGALCLMFGDLSTTFGHIPVKYAISLFTLFTFMIYISAMNVLPVHSPVISSLLIACFSVGRFFEAHLVTSMYRKIATEFHPNDRENAARAVGISDQLSTTIGSIMSSLLVVKYASC